MIKDKETLLEGLATSLYDFSIFGEETGDWERMSDTCSLWAGNPDSKIMVVQLCPDRVESHYAEINNCNKGYVMFSPAGHLFRDAVKRAGFDNEKDFFYCNVIPYFPIGGTRLSQGTIRDFAWTFQSMKEIVQPRIVIALGREVYNVVTGQDVPVLTYEKMVKQEYVTFIDADIAVLALDNHAVIKSEGSDKNHHFFNALRRLYVKSHFLNDKPIVEKSEVEDGRVRDSSVTDRVQGWRERLFRYVRGKFKEVGRRRGRP